MAGTTIHPQQWKPSSIASNPRFWSIGGHAVVKTALHEMQSDLLHGNFSRFTEEDFMRHSRALRAGKDKIQGLIHMVESAAAVAKYAVPFIGLSFLGFVRAIGIAHVTVAILSLFAASAVITWLLFTRHRAWEALMSDYDSAIKSLDAKTADFIESQRDANSDKAADARDQSLVDAIKALTEASTKRAGSQPLRIAGNATFSGRPGFRDSVQGHGKANTDRADDQVRVSPDVTEPRDGERPPKEAHHPNEMMDQPADIQKHDEAKRGGS